jgi:hypothetical protein
MTWENMVQVTKGLRNGVHEVALKCFVSSTDMADAVMQELTLLKRCRSPHIVQVRLAH